MSKKSQDAELRKSILNEQDGRCPVCLHRGYCKTHCSRKRGMDCDNCNLKPCDCAKQSVNTKDHNHEHIGCNGCKTCTRGITHCFCNRFLPLLERNPEILENPERMRDYLKRGKIHG